MLSYVMKEIFNIILIIFVAYFIHIGGRRRANELKLRREQLSQEGKLASHKVVLIRTLKIFGFIFGSSLIITIIAFYTRDVEFSVYNIFWGMLTIFIIECIIGSQIGLIQEVIKIYKRNGLVITVLAIIITICWVISLIYVRYSH